LLRLEEFDLASLSRLVLASNKDWYFPIIKEAIVRRKKLWRNRLFLMPPLYISDGDPNRQGCLDYCIYCPWRHGNVPSDKLKRLTAAETNSEAGYLLQLGYGDIELVAATDSELLNSQNAARMVVATREAGAKNVGINFFPLKRTEDYRTLAEVGCAFAIVWQETYLPDVYAEMHPRGPKMNMEYRLDAHDRALHGGIKTVGLAFLGGLADWRFEVLATIQHARYLQEEFGANVIFGMPRWKNGAGIPIHVAPAFYGDKEYELVGALYSLAIPDALVWFSTREHFELSARCARGGGCIFTLDCSTEVGGYTRKEGFAQFPVYSKTFADGVEWLKSLGFQPEIHLPW
jgi:2-iminoacetate synthase